MRSSKAINRRTRLLLVAVFCSAAFIGITNPLFASTDLFAQLDKNADGKITAAEVSDSQRPYFQRALRVADRDEDGTLTQEELTTALTEPEPVQVSTSRGSANFDITTLDRNNDGFLAKDEVPKRAQERMQRLFDQYGDRIPVSVLQQIRPGQAPAAKTQMADRPMKSEQASEGDGRRAAEYFKRLDTNNDGTLDAAELKNAPERFRNLDRNKDGQITQDELRKAGMRSNGGPASKMTGSTKNAQPGQGSDQRFRRLDRNGDGELSDAEIPQPMRQIAKRLDGNGDGVITREEFQRAAQLRQQMAR